MANNKIQHYRTTVPGRKPDASKMLEGQLALNITDRQVYTKLGTGIVNIGFGAGATIDGNNTWNGTVKATRLETETLKTTANVSLDSVVVEKTATIKSNTGIDGALRVDGAVTFNNKVTGKNAQFGETALGTTTVTNLTSTGSIKTAWLTTTEPAAFGKGITVNGDINAGTIRAAGWFVTDNNRMQIRNDSTKMLQFTNKDDNKEHASIISVNDSWAGGWRLVLRPNGDSNADTWVQPDGLLSAHHILNRSAWITVGNEQGTYSRLHADGNVWGDRWANGQDAYLTTWLGANGVSDKRYKESIKPTKRVALTDIKKMKFYDFKWKESMMSHKNSDGVKSGWLSQDLEEIDPSFVAHHFNDEFVNPDQSALLPLAFKAIQELTAKVESLEKQLKK
jgi:hypothetical protein